MKTRRTFIGLGVETQEEYNNYREQGETYVVLLDRKNIPDTYPIQNTMKLHQVQDKQEPTETGKWHLHTSFHPCSCPECRSDPTEAIQKFLYREDRNICSRIISKKENNTTNDSNGISTLTCAQLRLELSTRGLKRSGNKQALIDRLLPVLNDEVEEVEDATVRDHTEEEEE